MEKNGDCITWDYIQNECEEKYEIDLERQQVSSHREELLAKCATIARQIVRDLRDGRIPLSGGYFLSNTDDGEQMKRTPSPRSFAVWLRVLSRVTELLRSNKHCTLRDLFYSDVKLFRDQATSNAALECLARILGVAAPKGVVLGPLGFIENGISVDCLMHGRTGLQSTARFVLVVEKEAIFARLVEDDVFRTHNCILVTGKGFPDLATLEFVRLLEDALHVPVLALVDADPFGVTILHLYARGNAARPDHDQLCVPSIQWLGVRPSDATKYAVPPESLLALTPRDLQRGQALLSEMEATGVPAAWRAELENMLAVGTKMEIEALTGASLGALAENYLPRKLRERDWI